MSKWDRRYLTIAEEVAKWSKDPSTKVGAVITTFDGSKILSTGYNGFPRKHDDSASLYSDREYKYPRIVHAEANAIVNAACSLQYAVLYCTHPCCTACAGLIINAGIKKVIWLPPSSDFNERWKQSFETTKNMFAQCGVYFDELRN